MINVMYSCVKNVKDLAIMPVIGTRTTQSNFSGFRTLYINNAEIEISKTVRNLGFVFDQQLALRDEVQSVVKSDNHHLRNIALLKRYLDKNTLKTLLNSSPHKITLLQLNVL